MGAVVGRVERCTVLCMSSFCCPSFYLYGRQVWPQEKLWSHTDVPPRTTRAVYFPSNITGNFIIIASMKTQDIASGVQLQGDLTGQAKILVGGSVSTVLYVLFQTRRK